MRETIVAALMAAQAGAGWYHSSATLPVSATVMATGIYQRNSVGETRLQLLVLWRGAPGWFLKENGGGGGSVFTSGGSVPSGGGVTSQVIVEQVYQGGVALDLKFDAEQGKAWIHSHEVSLAGGNVIIVDAVDQPDGPLVRRVVHVEPVADSTGGNRTDVVQPQTFIRRSPELVAYLQCDHQFDDPRPYVHQMLKAMCDAVMLP